VIGTASRATPPRNHLAARLGAKPALRRRGQSAPRIRSPHDASKASSATVKSSTPSTALVRRSGRTTGSGKSFIARPEMPALKISALHRNAVRRRPDLASVDLASRSPMAGPYAPQRSACACALPLASALPSGRLSRSAVVKAARGAGQLSFGCCWRASKAGPPRAAVRGRHREFAAKPRSRASERS